MDAHALRAELLLHKNVAHNAGVANFMCVALVELVGNVFGDSYSCGRIRSWSVMSSQRMLQAL